MPSAICDNLLLNADFSARSRSGIGEHETARACPTWRQSFLADRWKVRYTRPGPVVITQAQGEDGPIESPSMSCLELRGADRLGDTVFLGQRIEAAQAPRYRRELTFTIWAFLESANPPPTLALQIGTPHVADVFGDAFNDRTQPISRIELGTLPAGHWTSLEGRIDGSNFSNTGLSVEVEIATTALNRNETRIRFADAALVPAGSEPSAADTTRHLNRFFQRHDACVVNSIGRALVVNAHEMHFQFRFDEMRSFPAVTLPKESDGLRVFNLEGMMQEGFLFDVTYRSRGSIILRATKPNHDLEDGFLSFVGYDAAILLDAEL